MLDGTGTQEVLLIPDSYGQLIMHSSEETIILRRTDAAPTELPSAVPALAIGGDWQARALYAFRSDYSDGFSCIVDFETLGLPTPVITLPAFASYDAIAAAWKSAMTQEGSEPVMAQLQDIYGYELMNSDSLVLVSSCGLIVMERISTQAVDEAITAHTAHLAGWWRLEEVSVGGIPLSPDAFGITDEYLAIDEQGFALLDSDVVPLQLVDGNICIGSYPVCLLDDDTLVVTIADGVEARFITEAAWYRQQIVGTWQLSKLEIPAMDLEEALDPARLDMQLIIQPDGSVILHTAGEELSYTLESTRRHDRVSARGPGNPYPDHFQPQRHAHQQ